MTVNGRPFSTVQDSGLRKILNPLLKALNMTVNSENIKVYVSETARLVKLQISQETEVKMVFLKIDTASRLGRNFLF